MRDVIDRHIPDYANASVRSIKNQLMQGGPAESMAVLEWFHISIGDREKDSAARLWEWASCWYPELREWADLRYGRDVNYPPIITGLEGTCVLSGFLRSHADKEAVDRAEQVLYRCPMRKGALDSLTAALYTLIYADRADLAARWSGPLLEQTTAHCNPRWQGFFAAIRAEAAIRQGRLQAAVECARAALGHLSVGGWGVAIGFPLATMVAAKVALGMPEDAARYLAIPVPVRMFQTPAGLHYLLARASYHLAGGDPEAALADYGVCADLMADWAIDLPGIAPWRIGAGWAHLVLERPERARALAEEQLSLLFNLCCPVWHVLPLSSGAPP